MTKHRGVLGCNVERDISSSSSLLITQYQLKPLISTNESSSFTITSAHTDNGSGHSVGHW